MPHPLETGTIRILRPDGSTAGTGFLVSKRLAITCAHVVTSAKSNPGNIIKFKFHLGDMATQEAQVLENGWSIENDVAVLELAEKLPKWIRPLIMQSSRAMEGRAFQGLGYPNDGPVQMRWPQGNISGRVEVKGYSNPLLQIQGKEIDKGLSGSAVVDRSTRRVIGVITAYQDISRQSTTEQARFGYAIPIETIWKIYPELEKELPPLPKRSPLVEGIHLLPNGYDFRIQNFLSEYLGTPEQPEPFGGREDALKKLDDWLDGDTQRLLLAASAGRGKSALLVRWLDRLITREDLALVFVPVSVRFRTNLASTFFASLAARLAFLHGEDVPANVETSAEVWRGLTSTYFTKPLTDEKKLLIVLDGLDEAGDWEAAADLFPAELPKNVRVIVSARFLAGDSDARPWLSRLGWEHTGNATTLELDPLSSSGVSNVLFRMGMPLDVLSRRVDIVAELHRLSEGDPLLVNLYVEDLWSRGEEVSRLLPEDLRSIEPGYEGYFDRWWSDQKKLWGKEAPLREKSVRLVFNLLCGAMGALTPDDLISLAAPDEMNTYSIEEAIITLKRFVIGIPDERQENKVGYVLTHPKLRDYFWNKLTEKEQTDLENRFVACGENILQALTTENLKPKNTPHYMLNYYGAHLDRSHAKVEKFLLIIKNNQWAQSWYAYEGAYGGYLQDVKRAWRVCAEIDRQEIERTGKAPLLDQEIRCALMESTLHSLAQSVPPKLLAQMVEKKIWTFPQGIAYIRQMSNFQNQVDSLEYLIPLLNKAQTQDLLAFIIEIFDPNMQGDILLALLRKAPKLLADEAIDTVSNLKNETKRSSCTNILIKHVSDAEFHRVLKIIKGIENEVEYTHLLCALAQRMPDKYFDDALAAACKIKSEQERANLLAPLIEQSPEKLFGNIFSAIHGEKKLLPKIDSRIRTLLPSGENKFDPIFANELLILSKCDEMVRARVLRSLVRVLPKELLGDALEMAIGIRNEKECTIVLSILAKYVSEDQLQYIILQSGWIKDEWSRAFLLGSVAEHMSGQEQEKLLRSILSIISVISSDWSRSTLLVAFEGIIPASLLDDVIKITQMMKDDLSRANAWSRYLHRLPISQWRLALRDVYTMQNPEARVLLYGKLSYGFWDDDYEYVFKDLIASIESAHLRHAVVLGNLLRTAPARQQDFLLSQSIKYINKIGDEQEYSDLFGRLALTLARQLRFCTLGKMIINSKRDWLQSILRRGYNKYTVEFWMVIFLSSIIIPFVIYLLLLPIRITVNSMYSVFQLITTPGLFTDEFTRKWNEIENIINIIMRLGKETRDVLAPVISNSWKEVILLVTMVGLILSNLIKGTLRPSDLMQAAGNYIHNSDDFYPPIILFIALIFLLPLLKLISEVVVWLLSRIFSTKKLAIRICESVNKLRQTQLYQSGIMQALNMISKVPFEGIRLGMMIGILQVFPIDLMDRFLDIVKNIKNDKLRSEALLVSIEFLPATLNDRFLSILQGVQDKEERTRVFGLVKKKFPADLLQEIIFVKSDVNQTNRLILLNLLIDNLPEDRINDAVQLARQSPDNKDRSYLLNALAHYLPKEQRAKIMGEAFLIVCEIQDTIMRRDIFTDLVKSSANLTTQSKYEILKKSMERLALRPRGELFSDIPALLPLYSSISNPYFIPEVQSSLCDITIWYP